MGIRVFPLQLKGIMFLGQGCAIIRGGKDIKDVKDVKDPMHHRLLAYHSSGGEVPRGIVF